jgi:hypothetical protein
MYKKTVGVLSGMSAMLEAQIKGDNSEWRKGAIKTTVNEIAIDTSFPMDTQTWETGIKKNMIDPWVIVEQYPDHDAAVLGHQKWVDLIKATPDMKLPSIIVLE